MYSTERVTEPRPIFVPCLPTIGRPDGPRDPYPGGETKREREGEREREETTRVAPFSINLRYANLIGHQPYFVQRRNSKDLSLSLSLFHPVRR